MKALCQARLSLKGALQKFLYAGRGSSGLLLFFVIFRCSKSTSPPAAAAFLTAARLGVALPLALIRSRSGIGVRERAFLHQRRCGHRALHRIHGPQVYRRQRVPSGELVEPAQGIFESGAEVR